MEYRLLTETKTSSVYNVDNSFYLIIPKIIVDKDIDVTLHNNVNGKMPEIANTSKITIARPFAQDYFNNINDISLRLNLKSLISKDLSLAKEILTKEKIEFSNVSSLNTPYQEFKQWYQKSIDEQLKLNEIKDNSAKPEDAFKENDDTLIEVQKRKEELLSLKQELIDNQNKINSDSGSSKGKQKLITNGKSTLKSFDDGFINILFLSFVTLVVTVGTMLAVIYVMR